MEHSTIEANYQKTAADRLRCIVCQSDSVEQFIEIPRAPVQCNVLWSTREEAQRVPVGVIQLGYCRTCSHISNLAFDPSLMEYTQEYENSLHFSAQFQAYIGSLISVLDAEYSLSGKHVIDVGCGKGEFLLELCKRTGCRGAGFDRSVDPTAVFPGNGTTNIEFVVDFYGEQYSHFPADLITCRHVLEHIHDVEEFVAMLRRTIGDRTSTDIFIEVPNALFTLRQLGIWDIIYEHVSYFTSLSLATLFERKGFSVADVSAVFDDQYLTLRGSPAPAGSPTERVPDDQFADELLKEVRLFAERYRTKVRQWRSIFEEIQKANGSAVVWGTGSKGVTFLNALEVETTIQYAVDINPRKLGKYVPGTGQYVIPPSALQDVNPDVIIVMNRVYATEISETLDELGVKAEILLA